MVFPGPLIEVVETRIQLDVLTKKFDALGKRSLDGVHHDIERLSAGLIRPAEILVSFHIRLPIPERFPVVKDILIEVISSLCAEAKVVSLDGFVSARSWINMEETLANQSLPNHL